MNGIKNKDLKRRILDISYKYHLSHIGSNLTAVDIIEEIYSIRKQNEPFILSSGHAGLALYCVLEKTYGVDADYLFKKHGVHPNRDIDNQIWCSSGSLGHGLGIAVGMALADRTKGVYCLVSDGECAEGSIWEVMRIAKEQKLNNLKVFINMNGWAAYQQVDENSINIGAISVSTNMNDYPEWLRGQQAHYVVMDEKMYKEALSILQ